MSAIASLYVVSTSNLPAIVDAADAAHTSEMIHEVGAELDKEYGWSGYVMLNILDSLDTLNVPLEGPGLRGASTAINRDYDYTRLIAADAKALLDRLDPAAYEPGDLLDGPIELGLDHEEARHAMQDTLSLLRETIARLPDDHVLLVHIS